MEITIILGIFFAITCTLLAEKKNRSKVGWCVLGFLFGIWSLLILALLDKK